MSLRFPGLELWYHYIILKYIEVVKKCTFIWPKYDANINTQSFFN